MNLGRRKSWNCGGFNQIQLFSHVRPNPTEMTKGEVRPREEIVKRKSWVGLVLVEVEETCLRFHCSTKLRILHSP